MQQLMKNSGNMREPAVKKEEDDRCGEYAEAAVLVYCKTIHNGGQQSETYT